jgi:hypothetical protein
VYVVSGGYIVRGVIPLLLYLAGLFAAPVAALAASSDPASYMDERATKKLAFVVGNSIYADQENIPSSNIDAIKAAGALRNLGFTVTEVHDVKRAPDFWAINFQPFLDRIKENDFVVFYFSGHGLNYRGENFVAMTDLPKTISKAQVTDYLVALTSLRELVTSRKPGLSLFLLDACRSIASNIQKQNGTVEGVNKGMAPLRTTVENIALGLSSDFGGISKGRDTPGAMSYYTDALLTHFSDEGKEFGYVKRQTRLKVIADTAGEQVPWFSESVSAEIYLKPSAQIAADEKTAWLSRLATNDYDQIWGFTQEYPVSRYVGAAKRWLEQHGKTATPNTTKVSPQSLDNAFSLDEPNKRIVVPRVDGPFGFRTVASISSLSGDQVESVNKSIGDILGKYDDLVVTRTMSARAFPDENAQTVHTVAAGSTVQIKNVTKDSSGSSWLEVARDGSSTFLPANRAVVGSADVGYSLEEIEVGPGNGLESLVDERPIRNAVAGLKANGRSISRVSVATAAAPDSRLQLKLRGRVAHAFYVLQQLGIPPGEISSALTMDGENTTDGRKAQSPADDRVRIRFFGH